MANCKQTSRSALMFWQSDKASKFRSRSPEHASSSDGRWRRCRRSRVPWWRMCSCEGRWVFLRHVSLRWRKQRSGYAKRFVWLWISAHGKKRIAASFVRNKMSHFTPVNWFFSSLRTTYIDINSTCCHLKAICFPCLARVPTKSVSSRNLPN